MVTSVFLGFLEWLFLGNFYGFLWFSQWALTFFSEFSIGLRKKKLKEFFGTYN